MGPITTTNSESISSPGIAAGWTAINEAGQEIGRFAALAPEQLEGSLIDFPNAIETAGGARLLLARETIGDIDAMLQPGLAALRAIAARGQDTTAPAIALWREFHASRSALLALVDNTQTAKAAVPA
uniref:hypothetical protein n=1 Tax=uncultured Altererythrobacter sp. TaxID=500840 RepID=UPI0026096FCA|nr:hypothetical protein [uncultured Altererythrobacter sp.]